jgi:adenylate cyclase class 2
MHQEIEVRFLEVNKPALIQKLLELGAEDFGEELLDEIIFYDIENTWQSQHKLVRLRKISKGILLSYKQHHQETVDGTEEIEITVSDIAAAKNFLLALGIVYAKRYQQKKRHKLVLDGVTIDFDTWPQIPTYVELEGPSEHHLKVLAAQIGLDWSTAIFASAKGVIENNYHIPVTSLEYFTFEKIG